MNRTRILLGLALLIGFSVSQARAAEEFVEGEHYMLVTQPAASSSTSDKVELAIVFMYGCSYCFDFEPRLQTWLDGAPSYVSVVRLPAGWSKMAQMHARTYYTAETLNVLDAMHNELFRALHVEKQDLSTLENVRQFFEQHGVDARIFDTTYHSPEVEQLAQRADMLIESYGVMGTPTVVVNGKYLTMLTWAGTYDRWFELLDELIAREHGTARVAAE